MSFILFTIVKGGKYWVQKATTPEGFQYFALNGIRENAYEFKDDKEIERNMDDIRSYTREAKLTVEPVRK